MEIKDRIKLLRGNLSHKEFADKIKIDNRRISEYESGFVKPTTNFYTAVGKYLNANIYWILTGEGDMYMNNQSEPALADRVRDLERKLEESEKTLSSIIEIANKLQSKKKQYPPLKNNGIFNYSLN